jgi:hypothetical protein
MPPILERTGGTARHGLGVVVAVVAGPEWPAVAAPADLARWRRLTPSATWLVINVPRADRSRTAKAIAETIERKRVRPDRLILFGTGEVGRVVLELVMEGALECAGILIVDVPCRPLPFGDLETDAVIRLVVHQDNDNEPGLVDQLKRADIDERIIRLIQFGATTSQATARAAEAFLMELVATVDHRPGLRANR